MARPAFHSVGLLPFFAGAALAAHDGYPWRWETAGTGAAAVFLIMLATYFLGEYYDFEGDSRNLNRNPFSGGSGALQSLAGFPRRYVLVAGYLAAAGAVILGLILHFAFEVGAPALVLGAVGLVGGVFYSAKPFQWAYRGVGECFIGFCYGWLTVNMGYYVLAGEFTLLGTLLSIPVALSITAVILINEFPDREADAASGKRNLVVTFGPQRMAVLYALLIAGTAVTAWLVIWPAQGLVWPWLLGIILSTAVAGFALVGIVRGHYRHARTIQPICAATIALNLLVSLQYLLFFSFR
ncbi:MAG: prenyltransferase [Clostridia bacterium]|nr:MAG: prenyltransferase [Clostridia bacterium]